MTRDALIQKLYDAFEDAGFYSPDWNAVEGVYEDAVAPLVVDVREALRLGEWEGVEMTTEDLQRWADLKVKYDAPSDFP